MNDAYKKISEYLRERSISLFSSVRLSDCKIIRPYLIEKAEISAENGSAIIIAVPYVTESFGSGNISEYAKGLDYHIFFKSLFADIIPLLKKDFPQAHFAGFTDHSPIDEINAAALAGLGVIGKNGLLITEKYSSFVFIGEIVTDLTIDSITSEIKHCENCGICISACPVKCDKSGCLSALTQKKGELTEEDKEIITKFGSAWGCDICQKACPHTKKALESGSIYTNIPFFKENMIPVLTYDAVNAMSPEEFSQRAYSWRGKQTILRNLRIIDSNAEDT
jgi:epoxyqueuosine reductase